MTMKQGLNWGIMGCSQIANNAIIPAVLNHSHGTVSAVASREVSKARATADRFGIARAYGSYEELLSDPDVDAVYISVPNALHVECAISAAMAGKGILCEKPLAVRSSDAQRLADFCAERETPLLEAFMYRFHPQTRLVQELVASGEIGSLREVSAHLSVDLMGAAYPQDIRFNPVLGGGALLDMGCYCVDILIGLSGRAPQRVRGQLEMDEATGVDIAAAALLDFGDGLTGQISCSFRAAGQGSYRVVGSKGVIEVPRGIIAGLGDRVPEAIVIQIDARGARIEHHIAPVNQYALMIDGFSSAVIQGSPMPFPPARSVEVLRTLEGIRNSV